MSLTSHLACSLEEYTYNLANRQKCLVFTKSKLTLFTLVNCIKYSLKLYHNKLPENDKKANAHITPQ